MINCKLIMSLLAAALSTQAVAQSAPIFPKGDVSTTDNHVGMVWLNELSKPDSTFQYSIAVATFAASARLDWHSHPGGQILLFTDGIGYYQEKGKPRQTVRKGDIVKCLPGVEHWHGATPTSGVTYLATTPTQKGKTSWFKRVTDTEYGPSAQASKITTSTGTNAEQQIIKLSKDKWRWMADKKVDSLAALFDEKAVFVHMGGSWGKEQEVNIIRSGGIHYKKADIHKVSVNIIGATAILLNKITLLAVVGGNEVTNEFEVTEVYTQESGAWKLGSLSFTKLLSQ